MLGIDPLNLDVTIRDMGEKVVILDGDMLRSWPRLEGICKLDASLVVFEGSGKGSCLSNLKLRERSEFGERRPHGNEVPHCLR